MSSLRAAAQACSSSAPAWFQAARCNSGTAASSSGRAGGDDANATPGAGSGPGRFVTVLPRATSTGYPESFQPAEGAASPDDDPSGWGGQPARLGDEDGAPLPPPPPPAFPEQLKVQLRQPRAKATQEDVTVDLFQLSRTVFQSVGDGGGEEAGAAAAAAAAGAAGGLTAADKRALSKLVGCLTKDGKRNKAEKMLLDAMHIIKAQLAAAQQAGAAGGGSGGGSGGPAAGA